MVKKSSNTKNEKVESTVSKKKEKVVKKEVVKKEEDPTKKKKRYFRCLYEENGVVLCVGRYSGRKPKQAANKALTALVKSNKSLEGKEIIYGVVEQTRNSKRKKYYYSGCRKLLTDPVPVEIKKADKNGKEIKETITYKHQSVVKKISEDQCKLIASYNPKKEELEEGLDDASDQKPKKKTKKTTKKPVKKETKKKETVEKEVEVKVVKKTKSVPKKKADKKKA